MRASELLAIDVGAELRALCREQLQGSWQVAAELVRLAVARGARAVAVDRRRRGFVLCCDEPVLAAGELRELVTVFDPACSLDDRHRAIVAVESCGGEALLWAAGIERVRLTVISRDDGATARLVMRSASKPVLEEVEAGEDGPRFELALAASTLDLGRCFEWLRTASRFAPVPIEVDGSRVPEGFPDGLASLRLDRPADCRVVLTRSGDAPHLWLLRNGVLATRATVPGFPAFEAVVEMGGEIRSAATPAELRAAVNPWLPEIVHWSVKLMISAAGRLDDFDETAGQRIVCLVLRAIRRGLRRDELLELPLVRLRAGENPPRRLSVAELRELAARQGGVLASAAPGDRPQPGDSTTTLVLSTEERGLLAELVAARLQRPAPRQRWARARRALAEIRNRASAILSRLSRPFGHRVVPEDELLEPERALLSELNRELAATDEKRREVRFCVGGGAVRGRGGRLLLPRHNPLVASSVRLAATDSRWLYPIALALLGEHAGPSPEIRSRWLRRRRGPRAENHPE